MKPQTPAEGIMKTQEYGFSKVYKVECGCHNPEHSHTVDIESDECGVAVIIYTTSYTDSWGELLKTNNDIDNKILQEIEWFWKGVVNKLWTRLKFTWQIWKNGYIKTEAAIHMSEQQTLNYAETLKAAVKDVKDFQTQKKVKNGN